MMTSPQFRLRPARVAHAVNLSSVAAVAQAYLRQFGLSRGPRREVPPAHARSQDLFCVRAAAP